MVPNRSRRDAERYMREPGLGGICVTSGVHMP